MYTLGSSAKREHVLRDPASVGAELVVADRGGDVTYHGPGQLVGYPIVSLAEWRAGQRDVVAYVRRLEDVLIAVLADFGIAADAVRRLHGRVGRRREDRGDRRARRARAHAARLRAERRSRPLDVRPHRSVRHPRSAASRRWRGCSVDAVVDARGRRPRRRAVRRGVRFATSTSGRRLEGRADRRAPDGGAPVASPVRLLGRLAAAGVEADPKSVRAGRSGCASRARLRRRLPRAEAD